MKIGNILSVLMVLVSSAAYAQQPDAKTSTEIFQDWRLNCAERADQKNCLANQTLSTEEGRTVAAINASVAGEAVILEFALPLMLDLTKDVSISVDGENIGDFPFNTCNDQACFVLRQNDEELINSFKSGMEAQMTVIGFAQSQEVKLPISLKGFSSALSALRTKAKTE